jgi:GT2 family glycosyltransferase
MVTYNRLDTLKIALAHIFEQTVQPASLIIVDNDSSDGTKEYLCSIQNTHDIHCLFLTTNIGAGGGYTHAMTYALENNINPDYFWMIEDDTYYDKNTLSQLLNNIEGSPYDMISLKGFKTSFGSTKSIISRDTVKPVNSVLLDGSLIKTDIIRKIGPPKKEYFMMCDDYEFSLRMKKNGYKVALIPTQSVNYLHLGGDGKFTRSTLWRGYYTARNRLLILRDYFSVIELLSYTYKQSKYLIAAALFAPDRFTRIKFRMLGIWHGVLGIQGKTLDPATLKFIKGNGSKVATPYNNLLPKRKIFPRPDETILMKTPDNNTVIKPLITVVTPTYNRQTMVQTTIESVINQTFKDWELIVIDDGSTDNTEEVVRKYLSDPRISYLKKENTGQPDSLNVASRYANGGFITFLDSDDEAYPHWLETVAKELDDNTGIMCNGAVRKLQDGTMINEEPKETIIFGKKVKLKFTCGSLFIKREVFFEVGGYDPEMKSNIQTDLGYRLLEYLQNTSYDMLSIDKYLVQLNIHDGERIRTNWTKVKEGGLQLITKHYDIIKNSNPEEISNMYMVVAFSNYKLKNRSEAIRFAMKAIKHSPLQWKNYLKCFKYSVL